ncbi:hypothetical protein [Agriterribacter sp.]|uniref:hypothetical protein n=1 Tax=Agriterribacter sp. TaxID=2821509 RepID=UPI002C46973D|nr:hypothetical protein [Agriterribacter sp.]HRO48089.1 hypothetical protein [Agriterribacter sp.]HRQ19201.1 hypothetical protein [Agriterribacter sp.]
MKIYLLLSFITFSLPALAQDSIPVAIKGRLNADVNNETSGLAASSVNKGLLYIHNDSGDISRFFLISEGGTLKAVYTFKANPLAKHGVTDCEDMAAGTGPKGKRYVYIGDIGDNNAKRKYITIYRVREPKLKPSAGVFAGTTGADPLYLKYPDGARDAETLMIDPVEKLFYIISKREDSVSVYTTPLFFKRGDTVTLVKKATLFFEGSNSGKWICGGDISGDGSRVLVKNYLKVYYWKRKGKEPVWQLLMTPPREMPYKTEQQGEAIGFATNGKGYYTISEGIHPEVYYYGIE